MSGVKHNKTSLSDWGNTKVRGKRAAELENELSSKIINRKSDAMEKGSRVVMTREKELMVMKYEQMRKKRVQKMRHPQKTLRTMNAARAEFDQTERAYNQMWQEDNDYAKLDKIYHKVNRQPAATQEGLVDLAQTNFMKSKQKLGRNVVVGV